MHGYKRVPNFIYDLIGHCSTDTFYVSKARTYSLTDLASGALAHIGITSDGISVLHPGAVVPGVENGRWSRYNVDGKLNTRKDLPKVRKIIGGWEVPNFGSWDRGSHIHYSTRWVFRKEIWYAKQLPILIDVEDVIDGKITIGFRVDRVFDRKDLDERDLHLALSLLRENLGSHASIVSSELSVADWLDDQEVTWELLPRGEVSLTEVVKRMQRTPGTHRVKTMQDRLAIMDRLRPAALITGKGEFTRYLGFQFNDNLVVLENLNYGNALYVMYEDWPTLSKRSRIDLLADPHANYERIIHSQGWENRVKASLALHGHDVPRSDDGGLEIPE